MACPFCLKSSTVKRGFFVVKNEHGRIQRYFCRDCRRKFSSQTGTVTYREQKPGVTRALFRLLAIGVSQRAAADFLHVKPDTVAMKVMRLGRECKLRLTKTLQEKPAGPVIMFDEMETFEHTKCKPLSMAVAVEKGTRRILAVEVARMPAKGLLAAKSRAMYGRRRDDRPRALASLCRQVKAACPELSLLISDQSPRYPPVLAKAFPGIKHQTHKGRRACVVGQGELKQGTFDPLFSLNHTCAMFRDGLKRLTRRTWATTKKPCRLQMLMHIYAEAHNQALISGRRQVSL